MKTASPGSTTVIDCACCELSQQPSHQKAVKKPVAVTVNFASVEGAIETLEGRVSYLPGDAVMTGPDGEQWPIERAYFLSSYVPVYPTQLEQDGQYIKKPVIISVLQMVEPFRVLLKRGVLTGKCGDWLVEYGPGHFGVVDNDIFRRTYELTENNE